MKNIANYVLVRTAVLVLDVVFHGDAQDKGQQCLEKPKTNKHVGLRIVLPYRRVSSHEAQRADQLGWRQSVSRDAVTVGTVCPLQPTIVQQTAPLLLFLSVAL